MAQAGYTPIKLYSSGTTTNVPLAADLAFGELAINYADGKLFYKNSGGTVSQFAVSIAGTNGQVIYNNSGAYAGSANLTFDGTKLSTNTQGIANYADYAAISAPSYQEGRVFYDTAKKALAYYNDVSTGLVHMGLDIQFRVINNTGSSIPNGSAVYVTGTSSGQTYPNIALARADATSTSSVIGLTEGAIANGAIGYVVSNGTIEGVNTSTYTVGQILYLSPYSAGQLMNTVPPTGLVVQVGVVTYVNASGNIYVKQTIPTNLPTTQGGTGQTSYTAGDLIYYSSGTSFTKLGIGTAGQVLTVNGGGTAPQWATGAASGVASITFGTTGLTPNTASTGAVTVAGTLGPANGGTGVANNAASTLTISGNFASTFVVAGANSYTFPNASDTLVNLGSTQTLTAKTLTNPTVTNYVESVVAIGNSGTSKTLDLTSGTVQTVTMTGNCTFTMPTNVAGKSFILIISTGAGSFTGTFTSVKWPAGTAPTLTTTASRWDIASFVADGTNWYGNIAQAYA